MLTPDALDEVLPAVLRDNAATVADWQAGQPGSWGKLSAQAILATRRALSRPLTDAERRIVWQRLWERLTATRSQECLVFALDMTTSIAYIR